MKINKMNSPLFAQGKAKWDAFVTTYTGPYDLSPATYAGMNKKISFNCPTHGPMTMDAKVMMRGAMCHKCLFVARGGAKRLTLKQCLSRFKEKHGDLYDYSHAAYNGQQAPMLIKCATHGFFEQKPEYHWNGAGCPKCYSDRRGLTLRETNETFAGKLESVFPGKFLLESDYVNSQTYVSVRCLEHDQTCQTKPNWLMNGYNPCTRCNHMKSSQEDAIADFLSKFTPVVRRSRKIIAPKELDIYLPDKHLAVEYCGMFWHSHFDADNERANRHNHANKYKACAEQGIRLLTIYESEWLERQPQIKRLLRNAVGASRGKLMARKCDLRLTSPQEARAFFDRYHPQGGDGHGEHYGLYWKDKLVACMRFAYGHNDRGHGAKTRYWTLGRFATRINVAGAASRLFKAFIDNVNPDEVKSFSDNRFFSGAMYEALGFVLEEEIAPDYQVWSPKLGLRPKPHYQRRVLPKRLLEHAVDDVFDPSTDLRTEAQMTYLMGCGRIYDCGKKRWVWRK